MASSNIFALFFILLLVDSLPDVNSANLPSFIKPCLRNEELHNCILNEGRRVQKQFTEGIPELGIESIDPLMVGDIEPVITPGSMRFKQFNAVLTGLKNTKMMDLRFDTVAKTGHSHYFGNLTMTSNYTLEGKLLMFPVKGKGDCITKIKDADLQMDWTWEIYTAEDGKNYTRMTGYTSKFDYGKVNTKMNGLFNDNKEIENIINNFINANAKDLLKEIGGPAIKKVENKITKIFMDFFKQIPYEELVLPA